MNNFFMSFVLGQALVGRIDGATSADKTTGGALLGMFGLKSPVGVVLVSSLMKQRIAGRAPVAALAVGTATTTVSAPPAAPVATTVATPPAPADGGGGTKIRGSA